MATYTPETRVIIEQILGDELQKKRDIVLLANIERHPLPERREVHFVKGTPDTKQSLKLANIGQADKVIIHTGSDEESFFAQVNTFSLVKEGCDMTIRCVHSESLATFPSVPGRFEIIVQRIIRTISFSSGDEKQPGQDSGRNEDAFRGACMSERKHQGWRDYVQSANDSVWVGARIVTRIGLGGVLRSRSGTLTGSETQELEEVFQPSAQQLAYYRGRGFTP